MPEFLKLVSPDEALTQWFLALGEPAIESEEINTLQSLGRVTSVEVRAPHPLPAFARSTVDGYAVRASDTFGASDSLPAYLTLVGEVPMGNYPVFVLESGQAVQIHTGGMLPDHADAVVMLEYTQPTRPGEVEIMRPVAPLENIIRAGEDVESGQIVLPARSRLRPAEIGGLLALGLGTVQVACQPHIAIISSGDEVVPPEADPLPGQVRDINTYSLSALVQEAGGRPIPYGIVPDQANLLQKVLDQALKECDGVLITAGSSASIRDLTAQVIQQAGKPGIIVHGINVRPGKPTILAVCGGKPVIGLPGNPVSALVIAWLFVIPLLDHIQHLARPRQRSQVIAHLVINVPSVAGREDWIPVILAYEGHQVTAEPVFFKSNLIFNLVKADGLLYIPPEVTGFSANEEVLVYLL